MINEPNSVLFLENLSMETNLHELEHLFRQYQGFREIRAILKRGIAFVEYEDELKATKVLSELNGYRFGP